MKKIIERPVLALVFFAIIILLGIYSYNHMTIGLVPDPEQNLPSVTVQYLWPGVSPDIILQKVLIPAENEIMRVKGVEKIKSRALIASGEIRVWPECEVEFRPPGFAGKIKPPAKGLTPGRTINGNL
jgi:multidrug efflux pump subunit AcrB